MFILQVYPTLLDKQTYFQSSSTFACNQTKTNLGKESANITSLYFNGHNRSCRQLGCKSKFLAKEQKQKHSFQGE